MASINPFPFHRPGEIAMKVPRSSGPFIGMLVVISMTMAGCVSQPYSAGTYRQGYAQQGGYGQRHRCAGQCGVVQDVRQVYLRDNSGPSTLGTVIGALAGGILGSTIGKGDGRTAATVVGAVAGGAAGNQIGARSGDNVAWQVVVTLDDGRRAIVTQRENPQVRNGDYVAIHDDHVFIQ